MKKHLFFLPVLILQSCISIIGLTDDYKKTTNEEKAIIHTFEENSVLENGNIYKVNAEQLKREFSKHDKSLVYCFTNGCSSDACLPIKHYMDYAQENGYKLFLVMTGFGNMNETIIQGAEIPYFVIDSKFYGSKYQWIYTRKFENDLQSLNLNHKDKEHKGSLFFFTGNKLEKIEFKLPK